MSKNTTRRQEILKKFNDRCAYCGKRITVSTMTIDHVIPQCKGGTNGKENLLPACAACNTAKGALDLSIFRLKYFWHTLHPASLSGFETALQDVYKQKFYFELIENAKEK